MTGSYPKADFSAYTVRPVTRWEADPMVRAHYLRRWPGACTLTLGMFKGLTLVGVCIFKLSTQNVFKRYNVQLAWELARLYILDTEPFNGETWLMAKAIKYVKKHRPDVQLLLSFADTARGHKGTIYKAANWIADGVSPATPAYWEGEEEPALIPLFGRAKYTRWGNMTKEQQQQVTPVMRSEKIRFIYWLSKPSDIVKTVDPQKEITK